MKKEEIQNLLENDCIKIDQSYIGSVNYRMLDGAVYDPHNHPWSPTNPEGRRF